MRVVYNPTGRDVKLAIDGEDIFIKAKSFGEIEPKLVHRLQELLPGLEYTEMGFEKPKKEEPKKKVEKKEEKPKKESKKVTKKSKKK